MTRLPIFELSTTEAHLIEAHLIHKLRRLQGRDNLLYFLTLCLLHSIVDFPLAHQTAPHPKETDHER